jgi:hypothetical protein
MDNSVAEIEPNVWGVKLAGITRIVRYRNDGKTFAPWDITTAEGRTLWSAASLESAFRWIQARTGQPVEALFAQALLEHSARGELPETRPAYEATQARKEKETPAGT